MTGPEIVGCCFVRHIHHVTACLTAPTHLRMRLLQDSPHDYNASHKFQFHSLVRTATFSSPSPSSSYSFLTTTKLMRTCSTLHFIPLRLPHSRRFLISLLNYASSLPIPLDLYSFLCSASITTRLQTVDDPSNYVPTPLSRTPSRPIYLRMHVCVTFNLWQCTVTSDPGSDADKLCVLHHCYFCQSRGCW